jgi:hypothetical protein
VHPYHPYITKALADQRTRELVAAAEAHRLAAAAESGTGQRRVRAGWLSRIAWLGARRRYREIELFWPDGVCSVVSAAESPDPAGPLASSRR